MAAAIRVYPLLLALGGVSGAIGVGLAAMASHRGGGNLGIAANFLLMHAPALLALSLMAGRRTAAAGAALLTLGLVLFCGDLVMRDLAGSRLFPLAAPLGGGALILGWLALVLSAIFDRPET
jgi:uncharacterized membrane protein YgdD (TMEM256/DUF423 family)